MKKLAKAQMGKIVKSVGNAIIKKRPVKQVFGTAGAIIGGTGIAAAVLTNKAKKEFADSHSKTKSKAISSILKKK